MSPKTILICDGGLFQPLAHLLAKHFERVLYFREWRNGPFPTPQDMAIGRGYEDIERVDSIMGCINEVDLFIFPDIFFAEEQKYLRSLGKAVFGAGDGEEMELYRVDFWEQMRDLSMPVLSQETVTGMTQLRKALEKCEDTYIKVSFVRGLMETWHHIDYRLSKPKLDELQYKLGAFSEEQEFIIEDAMECKREVGSDQIVVDGKFGKTVQFAVEGKDKTALAMMRDYTRLPKEVQQVNEWVAPILKDHGYRGYFSTEIRIGKKDGMPYLIDPTCRHASPCGETLNLMCGNLGEMIEGAAAGEIVEPRVTKKFAAQALITADMAETTSVPIYIDPKIREYVALYNSCIRESDGQELVVFTDARMSEVGSVLGLGNTIEEAIRACQENAKKVECFKIGVYTEQLEEFKKDLLA